jgi:microcystin-dependent protein
MVFHPGLRTAVLAASALVGAALAPPAQAETSPYVGEVMFFTGQSYSCPENWALADGRLLAVTTYPALFTVVSTKYGGDGVTTFALPDLRGRIVRGVGVGPGLRAVALGEKGGAASVRVAPGNVPLAASPVDKLAPAPRGNMGAPVAGVSAYATITPTADLPTLAPSLVVSPCVALTGTFPSVE